jgi:hypothetical protein
MSAAITLEVVFSRMLTLLPRLPEFLERFLEVLCC